MFSCCHEQESIKTLSNQKATGLFSFLKLLSSAISYTRTHKALCSDFNSSLKPKPKGSFLEHAHWAGFCEVPFLLPSALLHQPHMRILFCLANLFSLPDGDTRACAPGNVRQTSPPPLSSPNNSHSPHFFPTLLTLHPAEHFVIHRYEVLRHAACRAEERRLSSEKGQRASVEETESGFNRLSWRRPPRNLARFKIQGIATAHQANPARTICLYLSVKKEGKSNWKEARGMQRSSLSTLPE